jgi:hypothetical protein
MRLTHCPCGRNDGRLKPTEAIEKQLSLQLCDVRHSQEIVQFVQCNRMESVPCHSYSLDLRSSSFGDISSVAELWTGFLEAISGFLWHESASSRFSHNKTLRHFEVCSRRSQTVISGGNSLSIGSTWRHASFRVTSRQATD